MQPSLENKIIWHQSPKPFIIGIGGCSRSGKTTLALRLKSALHIPTEIISLDDCVFPSDKIPLIRDHTNWEIPESIDFDLFNRMFKQSVVSSEIVIIEGLFVFSAKEIFKKLHLGIYLTLPRRRFLAEKKSDLRWGLEPMWYIRYIWRAHRSNAFVFQRHWGSYPLIIRFPGDDIRLALPSLVSIIQGLH
ncbi:MAG: hypothetical protein AB1583_03705 [Bacteroidota bacterium]